MVYLYNGYYRDIIGIGNPVVGTTVDPSRVTGLNTVVHHVDDRLTGMIQANMPFVNV